MSNLYNQLLEHTVLPVGDMLLKSNFLKHLRKWRKLQWANKEELDRLQTENLRKLLIHATQNVPFFKNIDFDPKADPREEIKKFPILRKPIIKENLDSLVYGDKSQYIREASSGSSGIQGVVYLDKEAQANHRAIQILWWEWAGYRMGNRAIQTGITPNRGSIKGWKDKLLRTKYVSAYNLDHKEVLEILKDVQQNPVDHLLGYASSLFVFAQIAEENGITGIHLKSAVSWGDKLFDHFREKIERVFHTKVHDTYACTEGFMMAAQCDQMKYHMMLPQTFMEILDENGNRVPDGEMGYVVVTRLDNFAMPLIRYYLGDLAVKDPEYQPCACGRHMPFLKKVIGRDTDIIKTASGKYMVVHAFTGIFEHIGEIKQFRVVQHDLNSIDIEYIRDKGFSMDTLKLVKDKIQGYLKEDFPIRFKEVQEIPATASGKPQIIQSFLKQSLRQY